MEKQNRHSQREASIDRILRSSLRSGQTASSACVGPEVIAAWTEGTLPAAEAAAVEAHLSSCASCQEVLAVFARTEPPAAQPESLWQRWHMRWVAPIAVAATAAVIWVAIPDEGRRLDDAFDRVQPTAPREQPAQPNVAALQEKPAEEISSAPKREKNEAKSSAESSRLEARADQQSANAPAAREREQDAASPPVASPAAAVPQQEPRPLADTAAGAVRQSREAFAQPVEVVSPDPKIRWRLLPDGRLERSTDAGKTWEPATLPPNVRATAVRALTATAVVITAADGREFRSDDQGKSWNPVQP